jgi:hypothetical protein
MLRSGNRRFVRSWPNNPTNNRRAGRTDLPEVAVVPRMGEGFTRDSHFVRRNRVLVLSIFAWVSRKHDVAVIGEEER